jgi:hypothetical protein
MTGIIPLIFLFKSLGLGIDVIDPGKHLTLNISQVIPQEQFIPDTITTGKLTISGGGIPLPPKPPFPAVIIKTGKLTISGGGTPLPPKPPFPGVTITTAKLTISGKSK